MRTDHAVRNGPSTSEPKAEAWVKDSDLTLKLDEQNEKKSSLWSTVLLAYGSLGVIYGDIGTSLIYVFPAIFQDKDFSTESEDSIRTEILGAISLIFWTLTLITLVKYIGVVLAANDTGEGGTVALYALLCRTMGISPFGTMKSQDFKQVLSLTSAAPTGPVRPRLGEHRFKENARAKRRTDVIAAKTKPVTPPIFRKFNGYHNLLTLDGTNIIRWFRRNFAAQRFLLIFTMLATGLIIGDGILMPAFSVVSAISGLKRETTITSDGQIVGISIAILAVLFFFQHIGTKRIGWLFSPIIIVWLLCNMGVGIYNLSEYGGSVFEGLSPHHIVKYFQNAPTAAWSSLSGVLLCVTGTETMFAAMGHFSRGSIAMAFGLFTYPCLVISYLGQGAFLLKHPSEVGVAFWSSIPRDFYWPMLVLATLAAVVASQAAITGTFSLLRQAMALGIFPKLKIVHTGDVVEGQIFIPVINYALLALIIAVVAGFHGDSLLLADAYGVAVISVMVITTLLTVLIMITAWELSLLVVIPFACLFLLIEGAFLSSTLKKVPDGAWFAIVVSVSFTLVMLIWWLGSLWRRRVVLARSKGSSAMDLLTSRTPRSVPGLHKTPRGVRDESTAGPISAAGYAIFSQTDTVAEDNLAVQLATALVAASNKQPANGGLSQSFTDAMNRPRFSRDRPSAPSANHPILGRFSASHALSRALPLPAALARASQPSGSRSSLEIGSVAAGRAAATAARGDWVGDEAKPLSRGSQGPSLYSRDTIPEDESGFLPGMDRVPKPTPAAPSLATAESTGESQVVMAVDPLPVKGLRVSISSERESPSHQGISSWPQQVQTEKPLSLLSGLGLYYSETPVGIPEVMRHFLRNVDALHEVAIFLTVRFLPMPTVKHSERLLVKAVYGVPNFYQIVARYGYQDTVDHGEAFMSQIKATIMHKLEIKAGIRVAGTSGGDDCITGVEDEDVEEDGGHGGGHARVPNSAPENARGRNSFGLPTAHHGKATAHQQAELERYTREREAHDVGVNGSKVDLSEGLSMMVRFADDAMDKLAEAAVALDAPQAAIDAYAAATVLLAAFEQGVVYYLGRTWTRSKAGNKNPFHNIIIGTCFRTMELLAYNDSEAWHIPLDKMVELGMTVEV